MHAENIHKTRSCPCANMSSRSEAIIPHILTLHSHFSRGDLDIYHMNSQTIHQYSRRHVRSIWGRKTASSANEPRTSLSAHHWLIQLAHCGKREADLGSPQRHSPRPRNSTGAPSSCHHYPLFHAHRVL